MKNGRSGDLPRANVDGGELGLRLLEPSVVDGGEGERNRLTKAV